MSTDTLILLVLLAAGGYYLWSQSASATATPTGTSTGAAAGTVANTAASTGTPSGTGTYWGSPGTVAPDTSAGSATVLPPPAVSPGPANPIIGEQPIQHAGELAGLYSLLSSMVAPGTLHTAAQWNSLLSNAWYNYAMMTGGLPTMGQVPDPMAVFPAVYPQFDGTQTMSLDTYWAAMSVYLKSNQGLSGVRSWAV